MSRDIGGTYQLPGGGLATFGEKPIPSAKWNANFNDIATALTDSLSRSGKGAMLADLNMGGFSITNALNLTLTGALTLALGTAAAPSLAFTGAASTGIYAPAAGQIGIAVGGSAAYTINANRQHTIAAPVSGSALTVNGAASSNTPLTVTGGAGGNASVYLASPTTAPSYVFFTNAGGEKGRITVNDDGAMQFANGNPGATTRFSIAAGGQFVINAAASGNTFTVTASATGAAAAFIGSTGATCVSLTPGAGTRGLDITYSSTGQTPFRVTDGTTAFSCFINGSNGALLNVETNHQIELRTNNLTRFRIINDGGYILDASDGTPTTPSYQLRGPSPQSVVLVRVGDTRATSSSTLGVVESFTSRNDGNTTFGGRFGASFWRAEGAAIASGAMLGIYAFGGVHTASGTYNPANHLYAASIVGVAEGSFTGATAMATGISFRTGSTGDAINAVNVPFGTERVRIDSAGKMNVIANSTTLAMNITDNPANGRGRLMWNGTFDIWNQDNGSLRLGANNNANMVLIGPAGNVTINAPAGGDHLTLSGSPCTLRLGTNGSLASDGTQTFLRGNGIVLQNGAASTTFVNVNNSGRIQFGTTGTQWEVDTSNRLLNSGRTQPAFIARRTSTSQTSGTTVLFNTEDRDQAGEYDPATGVYTAAVAGWRVASFMVYLNNVSGIAQNPTLQFSGTGAIYRGRDDFRGAGGHANGDTLSYGSSMVLWMNAGETLSVTSNVAFSALNVTAASGNHFAVHTLS